MHSSTYYFIVFLRRIPELNETVRYPYIFEHYQIKKDSIEKLLKKYEEDHDGYTCIMVKKIKPEIYGYLDTYITKLYLKNRE